MRVIIMLLFNNYSCVYLLKYLLMLTSRCHEYAVMQCDRLLREAVVKSTVLFVKQFVLMWG